MLQLLRLCQLNYGVNCIIQEINFRPVTSKPQRFPKFSSFVPGYVPWFIDESEIRVNSVNLFRALGPVAAALEAELLQVGTLPMAEEARRSLEAYSRQS